MNSIEKLGIGGTSFLAIFGIQELDIPAVVTAITQIIVALGTLFTLFNFKNSKNGKN